MRKIYMSSMALLLAFAMLFTLSTGCHNKEEGPEKEGDEDEMYDNPEAAAKFQFERTKDPATGTIPQGAYMEALNRTIAAKGIVLNSPNGTSGVLNWIERGPNSDATGPSNGNTRANNGQTAGRIDAIMVDSSDATHKTVYIGGRDGGLWKTTDITASPANWILVNDYLLNQSIAAICQDPTDYNTMYLCTGESYGEGGAVQGNGVFKSIDHGVTWVQLPSTTSYVFCTRILCDYQGNIYLGTRGNGLLRSTKASGGAVWTDITPTGTQNRIADLEITSTSGPARLHVTTGIFNASAYRYTDIPATVTTTTGWSSPTTPFPALNQRCELGVSGNVLYAIPCNSSYNVTTIYKSTDGGDNWAATGGIPPVTSSGTNWASGQGWYALTCVINPTNSNEVIVGGLDQNKSTDGGNTWTRISQWVGTSGQYVHADQHKALWYDGGTKLLFGCDGGIHYSSDGGTTIRDRNQGLRIKQFYSVAMHPTTTNYFIAGAQDNGTHQLSQAGLGASIEVFGGDGAIVGIDQDEPQFQVGAYVYCNFRRSSNSGATWSFGPSNNNGQFIDPFDYDNVGNRVYAGTSSNNYLRWENPQSGFTYTTVPLTALGGSIGAVTVSPYTANRVYFGTTAGKVVRADGADATPTATDITPAGMSGYVNNVAVGTSDQNLIATVSSYNVNEVWSSTNGGTSWTACDGNLPNMPVYWALFNPDDNNKVTIATETGVWETDQLNGASTVWTADPTFPTVRATMLKYRPSDRTVAASTYGRGVWSTTLPGATCTPASITTPPANTTVCAGTTASFSVVAAGSAPLTYQWQVSTGGPFSDIGGATSATYSFTATAGQNGNQYRVNVTGNCAPLVATSAAATLTVNPAAVITAQPQNTSACVGNPASFSVTATGVTTYQWQVSTGGGPFTNVPAAAPYSGTTTATLNISAVTAGMNGNQYRVLLNTACQVTSNAGTLTVNNPAAITTGPANTTVCAGSNATFTVTATGAVSYSWESATALAGPYTPVVGAPSSPTLTLTGVTVAMSGTYYRVVVTGSCTPPATSAGALLTVNPLAVISNQPQNATVCEGSNATFSVTASNASTYQWQVSTGGGPFANVPAAAPYSGTTTATLTITAATFALNGNQYRVIINNSTCPVTSSAGTLTVNQLPVLTAQPQPTAVCNGTNATFSVTATGTGLTYQWQQATALAGPYTAVAGAPSSPTLTLTAVTPAMNGNYYRVVVSGTCTPPVTSNGALLTVNTVAVINTQPVNTTACFSASGTNTSFFVGATGTGLAYQWQYSTDGGNTFANVPNAAPYSGVNAATLNITGVTLAMNNYQFKVLVTSTCSPTGTMSSTATLTVINPVTINAAPVPFIGCVGNTATFTVAATGTGLTYQWQLSSDGVTYGNVPNNTPYSGVNTATLTITNIQTYLNNYRFRVIVNATPCGSVTTAGVLLTVNVTPSVVLTGAAYTSINPSVPSQLYVTVSPAGNYTYQYKRNGVVDPTLTKDRITLSVDLFGSYQVTATNTATGCSGTSNIVVVKDSASGRLFIYPNPNKGKFQVRYYNNGSTATVRSINVFDNKGARIYNHQFPTTAIYERMDVDLSEYAAGIYVVELMDADGKKLATGTVKKD